MDITPITDIGDAVLVAVADALRNFLGFLPQLVGALIVLILGWIVAGILARLVEGALKAVGFERAAQASGIAGFIRQSGAGAQWTTSRVVAEIVKWFVRLIALQAAAAILGMPQLTAIINSILLFLPNVVVALAIVVVGALIARFVGGVVRGATSEMGFGNPDLMANIARYAIIVFAVIAAINQLGIAPTVVNTLFIATVGAVAAAFALAFGLGGRDVAAQITQSWYTRGQEASQRVAEYAQRKQVEQASATQPVPATSYAVAIDEPAGSTPPPRG